MDSPLNCESCHSGLRFQDISSHSLNDGLCWWLAVEFLAIILVVHVVPNSDELAPIVGACQKDDSDANNLRRGQARQIGGIGFEEEFVYANGNRANEERVQLLVMFGACKGQRRRDPSYHLTYDVAEPT